MSLRVFQIGLEDLKEAQCIQIARCWNSLLLIFNCFQWRVMLGVVRVASGLGGIACTIDPKTIFLVEGL